MCLSWSYYLKGIVKNEQFSQMIRRCLDEENLGDQVQEAIFAPRLTRSKVKDVISNGQVSNNMKCFNNLLSL